MGAWDLQEGFYEATIDMPSRAGLLTLAVIVNGATLPCTPTTIQVREVGALSPRAHAWQVQQLVLLVP